MKKSLTISGIVAAASLAFSIAVLAQGYSFNSNLTVGSTGPDVSALQTWLIANGYSIPAIVSGSVAKGRFGSQTKAAVMAYQKASGLPSTGFVGPLTRAKLNSVGTSAGSAPAGMSIAGASTAASTSPFPPGFNTPGANGIISVTQGPISNTTLYAGQKRAPIMDVRIQAQYSDLVFPGLVVDLGTNTAIYNYVFSTIYVVDASTNTVLATVPLNPTTVVQDQGQYVVYTQGYELVIPKGTTRDILIEADLYPTITSTYLADSPWYVSIDPNAVGGVDGIGQDLYGPPTGFYNALTIDQNQQTNATANISLDASSPLNSAVGVTNTTNGQYLGLPVMVFDVNSQGDNLHLHNVTVNFALAGVGTVNAAYLFQGSTQVASAAVSNNQAVFQNIVDGTPGASIPINTTVPYTVKVDVSNLTGAGSSETITASTSALTIYNSLDSNIVASSIAQGNQVTVAGQGAVFSLAGTPTYTKISNSAGGSANTSFIYTATFNINATAIGENVVFNLPQVAYGSFGTTTTGANIAQVWQNGSPIATTTTANFSAPSNTTVSNNGNTFTLAQNQSVTIPVTYSWQVTNPAQNTYALQLNGIQWAGPLVSSATTTTNFMAGQTAWRSAAE